MMRMVVVVEWSLVAMIAAPACGADVRRAERSQPDARPAVRDAPSRDASARDASFDAPIAAAPAELSAFADAVRRTSDATRQNGSPNCAAALPILPAASAADVRRITEAHLARLYGTSEVLAHETPCGGDNLGSCPAFFQNHVAHIDGRMTASLPPHAMQVEQQAAPVVVTIWTLSRADVVFATAVTIAGRRGGFVMGLGLYTGLSPCGP